MEHLIGREEEKAMLQKALLSDEAELKLGIQLLHISYVHHSLSILISLIRKSSIPKLNSNQLFSIIINQILPRFHFMGNFFYILIQ